MCLGVAALLAAWVYANPPFAAPDEWSHYLRAIGLTDGHLVGTKAAFPVAGAGNGRSAEQARKYYGWLNQSARSVVVPAGMFAPDLDCDAAKPTVPASCLDLVQVVRTRSVQITPVGNYEPLPYLLPGLLARTARGPLEADRAGRTVAGLTGLLFLVLAVVVTGSGSRWRLAGLALAITPMVLFIASTLNPSGLEICTALAFGAAVVRLTRDARSKVGWGVVGVSGAAVALSRTPGPVWILLASVLGAVFWESPRLPRAYRPRLVAISVVPTAVVADRVFEGLYGSNLPLSLHQSLVYLPHAFSQFPEIWKEEIGVFGSLDSSMPAVAYVVWTAVLAVLLIAALTVGTRRQRVGLLVAVVIAWIVVPLLFAVTFTPGTASGVQGRYVLPAWVLVPLLAGEVLARQQWQASRPWLSTALITAIAVAVGPIQCLAFWYNARRQSVGVNGPLNFVSAAQWTPPGGWPLWIAVVAAGAMLLVAAIATPAREPLLDPARR